MNNKLIKLLLSLCLIFTITVISEWLYAKHRRNDLFAQLNEEQTADYKADELPTIELDQQTEDIYADLVDRPLFIKGRKPVNEPVPETAQNGTSSAHMDSFDWQLVGIYGTPSNRSALFTRTKPGPAKDRHRKITEGENLDGWNLADIKEDRLTIKLGNSEKELLLHKVKTKTSVPTASTPAAPAAVPAPPFPLPLAQPAPAPEPAMDIPDELTEDITESIPEDE